MKGSEWGGKVRVDNKIRVFQARLTMLIVADDGMSTVEYSAVLDYTKGVTRRR